MITIKPGYVQIGDPFFRRGAFYGRRQRFARWYVLMTAGTLLLLCSGCSNAPAVPLSSTNEGTLAPTAQPTADATAIEISGRLRQQLARVQTVMQGMSLEQKLGQLLLVEYVGTSYQGSGLHYMVTQQFVGGYLYQQYHNYNFNPPYNVVGNLDTFSQQAMHDAAIPLLIATDQEGGTVNRLSTFHGALPSAEAMAATGDPQAALVQGMQDAQWLSELGMNTDLAPVVDVKSVDPPIGQLQYRMFGSDPETVSTYAGAFLRGLQDNGVLGCLKHFPGLGAVTSDPHNDLPVVIRSKAELEATDFMPYKLMIQQDQPAMIMSTDVLMPALDPTLPGELSPRVINGILRGELGYDGVVITDGLYMGGISATWSLSQAAVLAIIAGNDIVEGPYTVRQVASVITALKQAINQGQLTVSRIDQSVQRILLMKVQHGLLK